MAPLTGDKTYASGGSFYAVLTPTDAFGNATPADRSMIVSALGDRGGGGSRRLALGRYRVTFTATDAAGSKSGPKGPRFPGRSSLGPA